MREMPVRTPLPNHLTEAEFWMENAIRLERQPIVNQAFVDASRAHARLILLWGDGIYG